MANSTDFTKINVYTIYSFTHLRSCLIDLFLLWTGNNNVVVHAGLTLTVYYKSNIKHIIKTKATALYHGVLFVLHYNIQR